MMEAVNRGCHEAGGLSVGLSYLVRLRRRLVGRPATFRRLAMARLLCLTPDRGLSFNGIDIA